MKPTAEMLTAKALDEARCAYRAKGEALFESFSGIHGVETGADRFIRQLKKQTAQMAEGALFLDPFTDDDWHLLLQALQLEHGIHFTSYTDADDCGSSDIPGFDTEEEIVSTDETDLRTAVTDALYDYCLTAGALAKEIEARHEQRLFSGLLPVLELNCRDYDYEANENGGLTEVQAKDFCSRLHAAQRGLWAAVQIECKRRTIDVSANAETEEAATVPAAPTAEPRSQTTESPTPINLGEWARNGVTKVDPVRRAITFRGNKGDDGKTLICPSKSDKAWNLLVRLLESPDPKGWIELDKNERISWRQQFYRSGGATTTQMKKEHEDLKALLHHIATAKPKGRSSAPTRIRIERRESTPLRTKAGGGARKAAGKQADNKPLNTRS